jgi:hypothetical protein
LKVERPDFLVHYAAGTPFLSLMDLSQPERRRVLAEQPIRGAGRYQDPEYVPTRERVEAALYRGFIRVGGRPERRTPHYALLGESALANPSHGHKLALAALAPRQVSFTWQDSFTLDPAYCVATGLGGHAASGRVFGLWEMDTVLQRFPGVSRPSWMELEFQIWVDPDPASISKV